MCVCVYSCVNGGAVGVGVWGCAFVCACVCACACVYMFYGIAILSQDENSRSCARLPEMPENMATDADEI